jgi:hypothetical protein
VTPPVDWAEVAAARRDAEERLHVRELARRKLDEALDLYFDGAPLAIVTEAAWTTPRTHELLRIQIRGAHL